MLRGTGEALGGSYPRYDLAESEVIASLAEFLSRPDIPAGDLICAEFEGVSPMANVSRTLEREVFEHAFGNDTLTMEREYGPYERVSRFFLVIDRVNLQPAGVLRLMENSVAGLKCLNDMAASGLLPPEAFQEHFGSIDLDRCWEAGTLAVAPPYRGGGSLTDITALLYRAGMCVPRQHSITHLVAIADDSVFRSHGAVGFPWKDVIEPFPYLGSAKSHLVLGDIEQFFAALRVRSIRAAVEAELARSSQDIPRARLLGSLSKQASNLVNGDNLDNRTLLL